MADATAHASAYDKYRADDPIRRLYASADWIRFRKTYFVYNPICQHLRNGVQCREKASIVHHLVSPKDDRNRFLDPSNVVATCAEHHAGGQRGETQGQSYTPSRWLLGSSFPHLSSQGVPLVSGIETETSAIPSVPPTPQASS